ncbi:MAG: tRNA-dihydrouridine synthase family protein [Moraxellaceae bacterium]|nr:tRNA-dihydrouridine synthase family protein [Pseudobdellovibrionaceae bacterium]
MEGVTDFVMRDLLTGLGGIDQCVTEFLRVTDKLYPDRVFFENCPELKTGSRTRAGTPVFVQLLGGHAEPLAENASRAAELGALGIDLNFGCPAKTVNRHDGGATLLKSSNRIFDIIHTVRKKVPAHIPVTAKIRLGFDDPRVCLENAKAAEEAGAAWLTVHCRTKTDGYKPPAYWEWIPKIKEQSRIKIIANGEIWTVDDFKRCAQVTGCQDFMIGRAALRNPYLFSQIKQIDQDTKYQPIRLLPGFFKACEAYLNEDFATARTKQWLNQLRVTDDRIQSIFDEVKILKKPTEFKQKLDQLLT